VPERYAIAQVTPYLWENAHEVNAYVGALARELSERGHRLLILAPSRSPQLVRETRRRIRSGEVFDPSGAPAVLAVGELLPTLGPRRAVPSLPVDISRTLEELLESVELDIVHVHEPFAPSASSTALRHSRALNVGTFHMPAERVLSTQVARRFVELFFGRLDARLASFRSTAELLERSFPATYEVVLPGATVVDRAAADLDPDRDGIHIAFCALEERSALRVFLRALRRLPADLDWRATIYAPGGIAPTSATRSKLQGRVQVLSEEDATVDGVLAGADVLVTASQGQAPAPGLVLRAIAAGAVPVVSKLDAYEEVTDDGQLGLLYDGGDVDLLAAPLARVIGDDALRGRLRAAAGPLREQLDWAKVAERIEGVYDRLAARRHDPEGDPQLRRRLQKRPLIDVDLHMHTDHSHDCATPVESLLAHARDRGLGAIAVTDHNEISGALEAAAKAERYGVKVIVGEEVKTGSQGEVIGLFISEKIPRGLTLQETIAEIKRQGGLVYVPHPFDRLHSVPDYEHLLDVVEDIDAIEVFNPRVAFSAFNEEAARFAAKYRIVAGAGSDSHVPQGLGSVKIAMRDFDGPEEFLESLRDADIVRKRQSLLYVQALKFLQTKASPAHARKRAARREAAGGGG
jgi:predicted metal-dependent phosphoesterase TrpH/glycosyltransferase involved in cell wall biosynthesis